MSDFKFEVAPQQFGYNHLIYKLEVEPDHTLWWTVESPEGGCLKKGVRLPSQVDKAPADVVTWAHESARAWIDNYVETHLALQEANEVAQTEYGGGSTTELSEERKEC